MHKSLLHNELGVLLPNPTNFNTSLVRTELWFLSSMCFCIFQQTMEKTSTIAQNFPKMHCAESVMYDEDLLHYAKSVVRGREQRIYAGDGLPLAVSLYNPFLETRYLKDISSWFHVITRVSNQRNRLSAGRGYKLCRKTVVTKAPKGNGTNLVRDPLKQRQLEVW